MATRHLPGLIQDTFIAAKAREYAIRDGPRNWSVWRLSPAGWVWNADFARKDDAEDYVVCKLSQEDGRPV